MATGVLVVEHRKDDGAGERARFDKVGNCRAGRGRERLEIERDKLAADREDFEALMADAPNPEDLVFGVSAICVVAAVCLLLGGIIGFSTGMDIGRGQSPEARKIQVSRKFVDMMISIRGYDRLPVREDETPLWQRLRNESQPASVIVFK